MNPEDGSLSRDRTPLDPQSPMFTLTSGRRTGALFGAAAPMQVDRQSHADVLRNDLGVPILTLLRDPSGEMPALTLRIPAESSVTLRQRVGQFSLDRFEAIARDVGVHPAVTPQTDQASRITAVATMQKMVNLGPGVWAESRACVVLAAELAQLVQLASHESFDGRMAAVIVAAHEVIEGIIPNGDAVRSALRELIAAADREAECHGAFQAAVALELDHSAPYGVNPGQLVGEVGPARRLGGTPAGVVDMIEVGARVDSGLAVLVGEMVFTGDITETVILRRCWGTDRWLAQFHWPSGASAARLRVRPPGGWTWAEVPGGITTERTSLHALDLAMRS